MQQMNENSSQTTQELTEDKKIENSADLENDSISHSAEDLSFEKSEIPSADSSSSRTNKDIKSSQIGELILKTLRKENEVAYIRYASVYRKFNGVKDFISTLESLKGSSKNQLASIS